MTISAENDVYFDPYGRKDSTPIALEETHKRFPEWDIDMANASLSPTSTVRGWDSMPAILSSEFPSANDELR